MYATAVGLLMKALEDSPYKSEEEENAEESEIMALEEGADEVSQIELNKERKTIIERFGDRLKEFLDNA